MEDTICSGCIYLKENGKDTNFYSCQHEAYIYVQLDVVMYLQEAQSSCMLLGERVAPPPDYNKIAKKCRNLPEVCVIMEDFYRDNGRESFPFKYLPIQVRSCKGKIKTKDLYGK